MFIYCMVFQAYTIPRRSSPAPSLKNANPYRLVLTKKVSFKETDFSVNLTLCLSELSFNLNLIFASIEIVLEGEKRG